MRISRWATTAMDCSGLCRWEGGYGDDGDDGVGMVLKAEGGVEG